MRLSDEYYPDIEDITPEQLAEARAAVVALLSPAFADVDLTPGTPTGDLVVSPLSLFMAGNDEAHRRFMSDLDLGNVADGLIYSCEFVRRYLGNFAVYDVENARSSGIARLTFSSDEMRTVDRHALFRFAGDDDFRIRMNSSLTTVVTLLPAGSSQSTDPDVYVLSQTSGTTWAVDLPLEGVMTKPVASGAAGTTTSLPIGLVGLTAAIDFLPGLQSASLPELARAARRVAFAINAGSRNGTASLILRNWPESVMVSPVVTGDAEMLRTPEGTAMALQAPAVDIYYRSSRDLQLETQTFRLSYVSVTDGEDTAMRFRGVIPFLHRPAKIVSLEWSGSTVESLITQRTIYSRSGRTDLSGSQHCGTRYEEFYADIQPVLTPVTDASAIPVQVDDNGNFALFTVTYLADPVLDMVAACLEAPDNKPPGVSVLVKAGPLVDVSSLTVSYRKAPGIKVLTGPAATRITAAFNRSGYPEPFRRTAIHDAMRIAGALRTVGIACAADVRVTPADRRLHGSVIAPGVEQIGADWELQSDAFSVLSITAVDELVPDTAVVESNDTWLEAWAATHRTVRHLIRTNNINFIETA